MTTQILGVKVDDIKRNQILEKVREWLTVKAPHYIVTTGPEFILTAQKDEKFKDILNNSDLSIPDGFGLQLYCGVKNRLPGIDLMLLLCSSAASSGWTVGLLGGEEGVATKTKIQLQAQFPNLKVTFALDGSAADNIIGQSHSLKSCDLLLVALGHPKQEKFIVGALKENKFKLAIGVGGAFDYISRNIPRAPKTVRDLGMEWIFRIFFERPGRRLQRGKRIFRATIIFPLTLLKTKIIKPVE